jgi:glycosyltransferase involved in cell wall biosynthesis
VRKLIIQIPCLNEEDSLPVTLGDLPRRVDGFDTVEWLVIDDGSTDKTVEVARAHGVDHIVSFGQRQGLARAFLAGLDYALGHGADVVINTDADNQYSALSIPDLVKPILERRALIVIGARPISEIREMSALKRVLQRLGSWVVKIVSGTTIPDAPSGFRAIHRDAAVQLNVFNNYTYTLETIIQAGRRNIPMVWVPIKVNPYLRPSRLIKSIPDFIFRSILTIIRIFILYRPVQFFGYLALICLIPALFLAGRFLTYYVQGSGGGHIQSLIFAGALLAVSAILCIAGVLADLLAANRLLLEDIRIRTMRLQLSTTTHTGPPYEPRSVVPFGEKIARAVER